MYLWKSWRDARLSVLIYLIPMLVVIGVSLRYAPVHIGDHYQSAEGFMSALLDPWAGLLAIVAWAIGGDGIGRAIGDGSGAYVLTRPRSRRFFLWCDAGFSLGLLTVIASATLLLFALALKLHVIDVRLSDLKTARLAFLLIPLCTVVYAGLVYSTTYLCTLLIPMPGLARVSSVLVFLTYALLRALSNQWFTFLHAFLPSWQVKPFPDALSSDPAPGLWLSVGGRMLAIFLMLLVAQFVLERREIRA
jgi:ABC-type transport system involved in multi-copper enzyme maturation permease subunit